MTHQENICGGCTACCKVYHIDSSGVFSLAGNQCPHADGGCRIYKDRPTVCRQYKCVWLINPERTAKERPDRVGYVLDHRTFSIPKSSLVINFVRMWEYRRGALDEDKAQHVIKEYINQADLYVVLTKRIHHHNQIEDILYFDSNRIGDAGYELAIRYASPNVTLVAVKE